MRKIIVVGATGTIGRAVADLLSQENRVIRVGNSRGSHVVDLSSKASIEKLFETIGPFDGLICAAGISRLGNIKEVTDKDFIVSISNKLMGQVNLARAALRHIPGRGFITLTTGIFSREPLPNTAPTAMVNAALEGFVRAAALDIRKGLRINAVSPILITITAKKMGMDTAGTMSAGETAKAYLASADGNMTGQILDGRKFGKIEGKKYREVDLLKNLNAA